MSFISVTGVLVTQWLLHVSITSVTEVTQRLKLEQENIKGVHYLEGKASKVDCIALFVSCLVAGAYACCHVD